MSKPPTRQMVLLPEGPVTVSWAPFLPLDQCDVGPNDGSPISAPPTRALVESIGRLGVLQPVVVRTGPDGRYPVIDGRRRILAARQHAHTFIRGLIAEGLTDGVVPASLLLLLNEQRRSNPLAELEAIEQLIAAGATEADIARATGLAAATIRQRFRLTGAHPTLKAMAAAGELALGVLEQAASLTPQQQLQLLADGAQEDGSVKITAGHIAELKQARSMATVAALPAALFDVAPLAPALDEAAIRADERARIAAWVADVYGKRNPPMKLVASKIREGAYAEVAEVAS
jgi:ParB/RepB/Spo0J family partition protein